MEKGLAGGKGAGYAAMEAFNGCHTNVKLLAEEQVLKLLAVLTNLEANVSCGADNLGGGRR
eukprot:2397260-Prorocentrum_lima.AAC.1